MIVRANLEVRSESRGDQGMVFSGTRDEIKADIAAVRELGAEELHFDPSFDTSGGTVQGFLDAIELVRELAGYGYFSSMSLISSLVASAAARIASTSSSASVGS